MSEVPPADDANECYGCRIGKVREINTTESGRQIVAS